MSLSRSHRYATFGLVFSATALLGACGGSGGSDSASSEVAAGSSSGVQVKSLSASSASPSGNSCSFAGKTYQVGKTMFGFYQPSVNLPNSCGTVEIGTPCGPGGVVPPHLY